MRIILNKQKKSIIRKVKRFTNNLNTIPKINYSIHAIGRINKRIDNEVKEYLESIVLNYKQAVNCEYVQPSVYTVAYKIPYKDSQIKVVFGNGKSLITIAK